MEDHGQYQVIGETRDDAAGEAYDKVARVLNMPYPGGPNIDRLAQSGLPSIKLPRARLEGTYDFSFSGLKSAVINVVHNAEQRGEVIEPADLAASFQASVIEVLVQKTVQAAAEYNAKQVLLAGGVAANSGLRKALAMAFANSEENPSAPILIVPPLSLCGDNAAMIAAAGAIGFERNVFADMALNATPGLELR